MLPVQQIKLNRRSIGVIKYMFLSIGVTVVMAAIQLAPTPQWLQLVQFCKDSGTTEVQRMNNDSIHEFFNLVSSENGISHLLKVFKGADITRGSTFATTLDHPGVLILL